MTPALLAVTLWFGLDTTDAVPLACWSSDVQKICCPAACAAKDSAAHWTEANEILRACMRGLGCERVESATVGMRCNCPRKGS